MASSLYLFMFKRSLLLLSCFYLITVTNSSSSMQPQCHEDESSALLQFKHSFVINKFASRDPSAYPKVEAWKLEGENSYCCSWYGIECDKITGHVIGLDLNSSYLYGSFNSNSSLFNLVHLQRLNLADNHFNNSEIPFEIGQFSRLTSLDISSSVFSGTLPLSLSNLTQLSFLDMSYNKLVGQIPTWLMNLTQLMVLNLQGNQLRGPIPNSFYQLKRLKLLGLGFNNLSGTVDLAIFLDLQNLYWLQLSFNKLTVLTKSKSKSNTTLPKFQLLGLAACNLTEFPVFLQFQDHLVVLGLANNKIHGQIPTWLWNSSTETMILCSLRHNFLTGFDQNPAFLPWRYLEVLDLGYNRLQGSLPIPPKSIQYYNVTGNMLSGEIPLLICHNSFLQELDLSNNSLSGTIPQCLANITGSLLLLNLSGNSFKGTIPEMFLNDSKLKMIDLGRNQLQGQVPRTLVNCTNLEILVLEYNQIDDTFPIWLGALPDLQVLILRYNKFHGVIGNEHTNPEFPKLRIIDLSHNGFSGNLPREYFQKWKAMKAVHVGPLTYMQAISGSSVPTNRHLVQYHWQSAIEYSITIVNKGTERVYEKIQSAFVAIDLSSNQFRGVIPESMGNLIGLQSLNLSNNELSGHISSSLVNLTNLESLDLSHNMLSGKIPQQFTQLTFLAVLDVSHNRLTGPIPRGAQFNTFLNNSFEGNSGLCGDPLSKKCENLEASPPPPSNFQQDQDSGFPSKIDWIVIILGYGSGLTVGLVIGQSLTARYHEWFVQTFGRRQ